MENVNIKKAIAEEKALKEKHEKDMLEVEKEIENIMNSETYQKYLELKAKKFNLQNKQNIEKNKFYSSLQNTCTHPILITGSPDTNWSYTKKDPTCFCLTCFKAFDIPSCDLKLYYDEKRLIAKPIVNAYTEKAFAFTNLYNKKGLDYIREIYAEIIDDMEYMQGPCLPDAEDILFDYVVNEEGPKVFTKLYNQR